MEQWKAIEGTDGRILVSNEGRCMSLLRPVHTILKPSPDKKGYLRLRVTLDRRKMSFKVHREVAKAFIPNPGNLPQVNHIDGDKSNNSVSNLEWITNRDNVCHAIRTGLWGEEAMLNHENNMRKRNRNKNVVTKDSLHAQKDKWKGVIATRNGEVMEFESVSSAERYFDSRHITDVCKGKRDHVKGWHFQYAKGVMPNGD